MKGPGTLSHRLEHVIYMIKIVNISSGEQKTHNNPKSMFCFRFHTWKTIHWKMTNTNQATILREL